MSPAVVAFDFAWLMRPGVDCRVAPVLHTGDGSPASRWRANRAIQSQELQLGNHQAFSLRVLCRRRQPNFSLEGDSGPADRVFDFICIMWPTTVMALMLTNMDIVQASLVGGFRV